MASKWVTFRDKLVGRALGLFLNFAALLMTGAAAVSAFAGTLPAVVDSKWAFVIATVVAALNWFLVLLRPKVDELNSYYAGRYGGTS